LFAQVTFPLDLLSLPLNFPVPPVGPLVHPVNVPVADSVEMFTVPVSVVQVAASAFLAGTAAPAGLAVAATIAADAGIIRAAGIKRALASRVRNICYPL
jgi:hypothetical protein